LKSADFLSTQSPRRQRRGLAINRDQFDATASLRISNLISIVGKKFTNLLKKTN